MNEQRLGTLLLENNLGESLRGLYLIRTTMKQIPWSVCQLSNLQVLDVSGNRLTGFENNCFTNMTSLTHIYANGNLIIRLQNGVFDSLKVLTTLNLRENQIKDIGPHVFSNRLNLRNLRDIYLSNNRLTSLPDGVFDGLKSLRHLDLGGNRISYIGLRVFSKRSNLRNLRNIYLNNNLLTSLQDGVLDGPKSLSDLDLSGNRISDIGLNVFTNRYNLRNLRNISLSNNKLTSLRDGVFDGLKSLRYLYLSRNRLSDIGLHVFSNQSALRNLRNIHLNDNLLTALQDGVFDGLKSLRYLYLGGNPISDIGLRVFSNRSNLRNLRHIYLNNSLLTSLQDGVLDGLNSLTSLNLRGNRISVIGLNVFSQRANLRNLWSIDLQDNNLTSLQDGVFDGLKSLSYIYLGWNRISDIGLHVFSNRSNLSNLRNIYLNNNLLTSLKDGVFDGLNSLTSLNIRGNRIYDIGLYVFSERSNLRNLSSIHLQDNLLTSLQDGVFDGLKSLKYLDLSGNRISDIGIHVFPIRLR